MQGKGLTLWEFYTQNIDERNESPRHNRWTPMSMYDCSVGSKGVFLGYGTTHKTLCETTSNAQGARDANEASWHSTAHSQWKAQQSPALGRFESRLSRNELMWLGECFDVFYLPRKYAAPAGLVQCQVVLRQCGNISQDGDIPKTHSIWLGHCDIEWALGAESWPPKLFTQHI